MNRNTNQAVLDLANTYARYYVEDFSNQVMKHLTGSYPIPTEYLQNFIAQKTQALVSETPLSINSTNALCRFLYECAEHTLSSQMSDPESRSTWMAVSAMPSVHDAELATLVYTSASLYRRTVDKTLVGVIAQDATTASQAIVQAAQNRLSQDETGGTLGFFNWGILNDGMWLNGALLKAYDLANIYRPGDSPSQSYVRTALEFARQKVDIMTPQKGSLDEHIGELDLLISQMDPTASAELLNEFSQADMNAVLFTPAGLTNKFNIWELGLSKPSYLVSAIDSLSSIARLLMALTDTARLMEDQTLVSDVLRSRLDKTYDVVVLMLAGYNALRETRLADSLILDIVAEGQDPKVNVIANMDTMHRYHAAGGDDEDLVRFGLHLDPREGLPVPNYGYSLSFVMDRRDTVVPKIIAENSDRLERLRSNDAIVIQNEATRIVTDVVKSYAESAGHDTIRPELSRNIAAFSRKVTGSESNLKLDEEIGSILVSAIADPFVTSMSTKWVNNMSSSDTTIASNAAGLTVAEAAIEDAINLISNGSTL